MSDETRGDDPMQMMRDAYAQGIERWSKAMEEIVGSDDFAAASGQLLALYAQQQQSVRAASRVAAESMQMPTTEDLAEVAQLVINVERKLDEVTDHSADGATRLTAIEARLAGATADFHDIPARLAAIDEKLGALADVAPATHALSERLTAIEAALSELARGGGGDQPTAIREPAAGRAAARPSGATKSSAVAKEPAGTAAASPKEPAATKQAGAKRTPARRRARPADA